MGFTGSITALITLSLGFTFVESIATAVIETMGLIIDIPYAQGTRHLDEEEQKAKVDELHEFLVHAYRNIIFVGALIGTIIGGIFAAMVVWGAVKKNKNFLLPWLIFETLVIIGTAVCILISMVLLSGSVRYTIITFVIGMIELGVMIYFWLVVFSYFQELRDRKRMEINAPAEMKTRLTSQM